MDTLQIRGLYDQQERIAAIYPDLLREVGPYVIRHMPLRSHLPSARGAFISYSNLAGSDVEQVISGEIGFFAAQHLGFEWKVYEHDFPADLRSRLLARGFRADEPEAIMALVLAQAPPALLQPVQHAVQRLHDPDQLDEVHGVLQAVWQRQHSGLMQYLRESMINNPQVLSVYAGYEAGQAVCVGWLYHDPRSAFAGLWGGSTRAEFRGRGWYTALLAARTQEALRRGYRYLTIDAGAQSRPIVQRYGFRQIAVAHALNWESETQHQTA
ncbi:MAG: hypothetical protein ABTQ73_11070 [Caldilineales bacterium]